MNVTIGEKKTYDDWGLKLQSIAVSMPEAKINQIDIPGADGMIDITEAMGTVKYLIRELEMVFDVSAYPERWHGLTSEIANYLHGKRMKVILDTDPSYYYIGRIALNSEKSDYYMSHITLTGAMEPYKYELSSSLEKWRWDPFSFRDGIIRDYKDLNVDESLQVTIRGRKKEIVPTFICTSTMEVEWKGVRYPLQTGVSKIYAIALPEGDNRLTFYGNGVVNIEYRGGIL